MFLSKLHLNARDFHVAKDLANCQELHRTLLAAFPAEGGSRAEVGLLFRIEASGGEPVVIAQSLLPPEWERLCRRAPGYLAGGEGRCWQVKALGPRYPAVQAGTVLRFRLRANPTKRLWVGDAEKPPAPGKHGTLEKGKRVALLKEAERSAWLERKAEAAGFRLCYVPSSAGAEVPAVDVRPDDTLQGWRARDGQEQRDRLTFGSVLFEGVLEVTDIERFRRAVREGIGSAKAYGFGLLSLARAGGA